MLRKKIKKKNSLNINVTRLAVKNITNETYNQFAHSPINNNIKI